VVHRATLLSVVVVAGCGRLGFDGVPPVVHEGVEPAACSTYQWTTVAPPDRDLDLSITTMPSSIAVGWVAHADGALFGTMLAPDWSMTTDPSGTMIKTGGWVDASVQYIDGQLVAGEAETGRGAVKYDTMDGAFANDSEFGCPTASYLPKPPMLHAGGDLIAPTVSDTGLSVWQITGWSITGAATTAPSSPATGVAATEVGTEAFIVWPTVDGCNMMTLQNAMTGTSHASAASCDAPRVAASGPSVALVYETAAGVAIVRDDPTTIDPANGTMLAAGATSPRIVFDGVRYWTSYLDASGAVVVGYQDTNGVLRSTQLATKPRHDAYELAIVDHEPWIVGLDASGLAATRLCTP
jgi:hypothetical protein